MSGSARAGGAGGPATDALGLIAGNGRFPFLVAAAARARGLRVVAIGLREETDRELEAAVDELHWVGLGELGRAIDALQGAGVSRAVLAGQVQHRQIFAGIRPDLKLMGVLARLAFKNTDSLIGGVADALERHGIRVLSSTELLQEQLASAGAMTRRQPTPAEREDVAYGVRIARVLTGHDLGQTVVVKQRAAVALEAMEGTDETIRRAGRLAGAGCVVVKLAKPRQDPRFDVPVVGEGTLASMSEAGAAVLAVEAGHTLLLERRHFLERAEAAGMCVFGVEAERG